MKALFEETVDFRLSAKSDSRAVGKKHIKLLKSKEAVTVLL